MLFDEMGRGKRKHELCKPPNCRRCGLIGRPQSHLKHFGGFGLAGCRRGSQPAAAPCTVRCPGVAHCADPAKRALDKKGPDAQILVREIPKLASTTTSLVASTLHSNCETMGARTVFRRLRTALRRKKRSSKGKGKSKDAADRQGDLTVASSKTPILHPGGQGTTHGHSAAKTITRADIQRSANNQDMSIFFSKLPLELRRQIYREVWRSHLKAARRVSASSTLASDLRLHIYTDGSGRTFRHTQCEIHPGAPGQDDARVIEPWPFHSNNAQPPMWYWFAWVMRLHWDKHWKCQHAIMERWDPRTGSAKEAERSPFLPMFLTCKKMCALQP